MPVGRRIDAGLGKFPLRIAELRANLCDVGLFPANSRAQALANGPGSGAARRHLLLGRGQLRQQCAEIGALFFRVGLPALSLEKVARAGRGELGRLTDA